MRFLETILILILLISFNGCRQKTEEPFQEYTLEQFLETTSYLDASFSFDDKRILFSSNESGIFNAYSMSIRGASKENKPIQLTGSTDQGIFALSFFPEDDRVLFTQDKHGNEVDHIYLREANGTIKDLTPSSPAQAYFYGWTHDRKSFIYASNERDLKAMDIYEMDIESFESRMLFQNESGFQFGCMSPNKRYVALVKLVTSDRSDIHVYDLETQTLINLTSLESTSLSFPQTFSMDSNFLYYLTNANHNFTYVKKINLNTGKSENVYKENWDITSFALSHNGTYDCVTVNEEAKQTTYIYQHETKKLLKLPKELQKNTISALISRSEELILFSVNSDISPTNFYLYNIEKNSYKKLTNSLCPEINEKVLVEAQTIRYRASDGIAIPALYYQPKLASADNKVPALIWVHGGPGGQSKRHYSYLIQHLVNQGIAVLAVNNRGSSGYGKEFFTMADLQHGEVDLEDCLAGKKYLIQTGVVDSEKIGIMGRSYGGYLTLAALAFHPDEMAVGIDMFGISNWIRSLEAIPDYLAIQKDFLYQKVGHPVENQEYLRRISPLFHADNIKKPLLILQGANDPRVLQIESDEVVAAIEDSGISFRYIVFGDEGHGFTKNRNRLYAGKAILEFLNRYLKS